MTWKTAGWAVFGLLAFGPGIVRAENVWWDWEYNGNVPLDAAHPALWLKDHPSNSYDDRTGVITCLTDRECKRPTSLTDEWADIVDCPECIGGKYMAHRSDSKWDGLAMLPGDKSQGYWPIASSEGCPGEASTDINDVGVPGKYGAGTGWGNPSCMPGGATVEVRYRWHGDPAVNTPSGDNKAGLMPFAFPPMQYQALLYTDQARGDYIQFAWWATVGSRPEIEIGNEWVVTRMVFNSSFDGLDYYVHDDGSLEPLSSSAGQGDTRGALWTTEGPLRNELERLITQPNTIFGGHELQEDKGWKGFEWADGQFFLVGSGANMDLDYIRWAFDKRVAPSEPSALTGDVNQDGVVDSADVTAFCDEFKLQEPGDVADVDDNGVVDLDDLDALLTELGTVRGDINLTEGAFDQLVDILDFGVLAGGFGQSDPTYFDGDLNKDGRVDILDFGIQAGRFGSPSSGTAAPTPEPSSLAILALGVLTVLRRRW